MDLDDVFAQLRDLDEPVPRPARLPTEAEVGAAEARFGRPFPPDFRRFLLEVSNVTLGTTEPVTLVPGDAHTDFFVVLDAARDCGIEPELIPICDDNSDFYCLAPDGRVVYCDHNGTTEESWPDLATWINDVWIEGG